MTDESEPYTRLGALLREKRRAAGLTQRAFADELEVHQSAVSAMEAGKIRPDVSRFSFIAELLGIDVAELTDAAAADAGLLHG